MPRELRRLTGGKMLQNTHLLTYYCMHGCSSTGRLRLLIGFACHIIGAGKHNQFLGQT